MGDMPASASVDNDKISFNSAEYDLIDGRISPVSAMEDGTYNSHLTVIEKSPSRNTELRRSLDERHVNMIAFSTTVGIGCFLQSGKVIATIGPGGATMAYILMGIVIWSANSSLGEMTAVFPVKGPIIDFCSRFIDESVGFAVGWMAWFAYAILSATEISTLSQTFQFEFDQDYLAAKNYPYGPLTWDFGLHISPAVWAAFALLLILTINLFPVRIYGEIEYVFGCIKLIMMVVMIMYNVIISGINASNGRGSRFWTYQKPYGFFSSQYTVNSHHFFGDTARLLGIWSSMTTIFFSMQGMFSVSVTAAENRRLETEESIKIATRKIALRAITLYSLLVFSVGLNVPLDDPQIQDTSINTIRQATHSPFVVSAVLAHTRPSFIYLLNSFFIFSAFSCGVNGLYTSSRLLHALASVRNAWPTRLYWLKNRLERTTSKGVPMAAIFTSWLFAFLGFLGAQPNPARVLGRLALLSSAAMMIVYMFIGISFVFFHSCTVEAEPNDPVSMDSDTGPILNRAAANYPYRSHLQWARAAFAAFACFLLLFFNGFKSLLSPFKPQDFVASYVAVPIFLLLVSFYHVKDERTWNPLAWSRRATMNVTGPMETTQTDPLKRRGRLHRRNLQKFWAPENIAALREFFWVWLK